MKRILFAFAVFLAAGQTLPAGAQDLDSLLVRLADKRALIQIDNQWRRGHLQNDAPLLDGLLGKEWTFTVSGRHGLVTGNVTQSRKHYLADVRSGTRSYEYLVEDQNDVRIEGDSAVVTGRTLSKGYLNDEFTIGTSHFIRTYQRRLGRWQMVTASSTAVLL